MGSYPGIDTVRKAPAPATGLARPPHAFVVFVPSFAAFAPSFAIFVPSFVIFVPSFVIFVI